MKFRLILFSGIILFASLYGCSGNKALELPDIGIPVDELNQDLIISVDPMFNTFKIGDSVGFLVHLKSEIEVRTTENFNARLFVLSPDSDWQEIQEVPDLGIFEPVEITMSKRQGGFEDMSFWVYPKIQSQGNSIMLLVFITGDVYQDGRNTGETVGAYTIVNLKP